MDDKYVRVVAIRIANQLRKEVDLELTRRILRLVRDHQTESGFVEACTSIAKFDREFLIQLYQEKDGAGERLEPVKKEATKEPRKQPVVNKPGPARKVKIEDTEEDQPSNIKVKRESGLSDKARARLQEVRRKREGNSNAKPQEPAKRKLDEPSFKRPNKQWRDDTYQRSPEPEPEPDPEYDDDVDEALDRDWYAADESGHAAGDEFHNPFYNGYSVDAGDDQRMEEKTKKKLSLRARQRQKETNKWEQSRMRISGMGGDEDVDLDDDDDDQQNRVHLMIHNLRPPFLDGEQIFTRQRNPISAVRDPDSNMALYARKGSTLVKERRQFQERQKHAKQASSMAGTALGNMLGVKEEQEEEQEEGKKKTVPLEPRTQSATNLTMKQQRQLLPAFAVRDQLLQKVRENQVIVVIGETGSGKTTQLTQFLYEAGYGDRGVIGCTQPRRVAAMSVAKRVGEEMGVQVGSTVGYSIRFEDHTNPDTRIKYMTDGILLREALMDNRLEKYSCIIMDEAHERALNTDILLGLFKNILARRNDLKLIVTSATMNAERFSQFYGGAPSFTIPGRTFPVDVMHADATPSDYVAAAVQQVLQIHVSSPPGDILVFMTGQDDIETTCSVLEERLGTLDKPDPLLVLPIYSQMPADLQAKIFDPAPKGTRKVIVATNVAETSLTVDGICYVVDTGYAKVKVFNPKLNMDALQIMPISQANASQRSGRAGRTQKGVAYRLYTERAEVEEMYPQSIPETQRSNLANTILTLKNLGIDNLLDFNFVDPPPADTMTASLYDLWALGALDNFGHLTQEGRRMSSFPIDPPLAKMLVMSSRYMCSEEMCTIVAMLTVSTVFYRPKERSDESDSAREKFYVSESDHLTLLNVYNQWMHNKCSEAWCNKHFLIGKQLKRAKDVREQLVSIFTSQGLKLVSSKGEWDVIRKCICAGYFHQSARSKGIDSYQNLRTAVISKLHHTSALTGLGFLPEYVVYHELVLTSTQYLSYVTAVDPRWLAEFGGVFYSVREKGVAQIAAEYNTRDRIEAQIDRDRVKMQQAKQREKEKAATKSSSTKQSAVVMPGKLKKRRGL